MFDKEMQAALIADGEKLAALTGEDHGPWDIVDEAHLDGVEWTGYAPMIAALSEKTTQSSDSPTAAP